MENGSSTSKKNENQSRSLHFILCPASETALRWDFVVPFASFHVSAHDKKESISCFFF